MFKVRGTPIAVAVALALSPIAVQADGGFYGSVRIGVQYQDDGVNDAELNLRNWASRLGYAGETDLDNGLAAFGKLEFAVDTRSGNNGNGALGTRHAYIGVKGGFGSILVGQTYHTWYNTVIGPVDQPWWGSCNGCVSYTGRTSDGITYSGSMGTIGIGVTAYMIPSDGANNTDDLDGYEVGLTYDAGIANIGLAMQEFEGSEAVMGIAANGSFGTIGYAANVTMQGGADGAEDTTGMDLYLSYGNVYLDIGSIDQVDTSTGFTLGYTYPIGKATTSWFEVQSQNTGADGAEDVVTARAALKYDWK